ADRNRSHWSTSKTPSYTKSVSWQHHPARVLRPSINRYQYHFCKEKHSNERIALFINKTCHSD
ncbi:hypothetical protein, partial [Escherichia coli]|uniref:hypothetical protein n=1 Tax=Escherichia coli TaxID=562 RepID=UPI001A7E164B